MYHEELSQLSRDLGPAWKAVDYSDPGDFAWLWGLARGDEHIETWLCEEERNLLILWDGMPAGLDVQPVNVTDQLTPFDWTVSLSHYLLDRNEPPALRIFLLDNFSSRLPYAFGCSLRDGVAGCCPWMKAVPLADGSADCVARLRTMIGTPHAIPALNMAPDARASVDALVQAWTGRLSRAAYHHDVNNLLAPLILLESLGAPGEFQLGREALRQHARWLGLTSPPPSAASRAGRQDSGSWLDPGGLAREIGREVRLLLVDDQAEAWSRALTVALGLRAHKAEISADELTRVASSTSGDVSLFACSGARPLLGRLEALLAEPRSAGGAADWRFRLGFTDAAPDVLEILLLDLRLAADPGETETLNLAVRELITRLDGRLDGKWPWGECPLLSLHETADGDSLAPTLLSRLIASADFSLPIILFSATGQRGMVEVLRPYRTIVTAFEKPRILGGSSRDFLDGARSQWNAAIRAAEDILRGRVAALELGCADPAVPSPALTATEKILVDIFTDETGSEQEGTVRVGALIVAGPERTLPDIYRYSGIVDYFYETFGSSFGKRREKSDAGKAAARRRFDAAKHAFRARAVAMGSSLARAADEAGGFAAWVELSASHDTGSDPIGGGDVDAGRQADNLYRAVIASLLEAGVYHLLPRTFPDARIEYRVHLATRARAYKKVFVGGREIEAISQRLREEMDVEKQRWGIAEVRLHDRKLVGILQYLGQADARPIVQAVSRQYAQLQRRPVPVHARGYTLSSLSSEPLQTNAAPAHFATDALVSTPGAVEPLRSRGFRGQYGTEFLKHLNAARLAANGFVGRALAVTAGAPVRTLPADDVRRLLAGRVRDETRSISGREFMTAVNEISLARRYATFSGTVMRSRGETASCRIRTQDVRPCECPLPQTGDQWLYNGEAITFEAEISYDTGEAALVWRRLVSVDQRAPGLEEFVTSRRLAGVRIERVENSEAFISCGPFVGVWPFQADGLERPPPVGKKYDLTIDSIDPREQRAYLSVSGPGKPSDAAHAGIL